MISLGIITIVYHRKEVVFNINLFLLSLFILSPLLAESVLRAAIFLGVSHVRSPALYADPFSDDDYWTLQRWWVKQYKAPSPRRVHAVLGWSQANITEDNPLGLQDDTLAMLRPDDRKKILFYGNSFVKGASDPEYYIPRYLNRALPEADVIDLGLGGYGTDQIFLLFERTHTKVTSPLILMGILTYDLDRAVLSTRWGQKPYFVLNSDAQLSLKGTPIERDQEEYFRLRAPHIRSYFVSLLLKRLGLHGPDIDIAKRRINAKLIENTKTICDKRNMQLLYVIFYTRAELKTIGWRETFIKEMLQNHGIPYVDTKVSLSEYARRNTLSPESAFYAENGHHNNLGNKIIGDAILKYLRELGYKG